MSDVAHQSEHRLPTTSREHTLGSAELAGSAVAAIAFLVCLLDWPTMPLGEVGASLRIGGYIVWAAAVAYLLLTAIHCGMLGLRLRGNEPVPAHAFAPIVIHSLVLVVSAVLLLRGQHSRVLLLRLDWLLPALAIVSAIALILACSLRWTIHHDHLRREPDSTTAGQATRWPTTLLIVDCLVLTTSIIYLESLALPDLVRF